MEVNFSDYRDVEGTKVPFMTEMTSPQFAFEIKLDSIEYNVDIPSDNFDLPQEIKALVN
jgi:hypothetical protein